MEIIVVSDTNILIDLIEVGLLDEFFSLPWEIHTTDMIIHELKDALQKEMVDQYHTKGLLHVKSYDATEMFTLTKFHTLQRNMTKVSIQDCSVWLYAMNHGYTLLTGDAKLRGAATKTNVDVHGIIYVIDKLVDKLLLTKEIAANKLKELALLNPRLPLSEIDKRVKLWYGSKKEDGL